MDPDEETSWLSLIRQDFCESTPEALTSGRSDVGGRHALLRCRLQQHFLFWATQDGKGFSSTRHTFSIRGIFRPMPLVLISGPIA